MSTWLRRADAHAHGYHWIDVGRTSAAIHAQDFPLIEHEVDWPHLWKPGDRVYVTLSDRQEWVGAVLAVSAVTRKVLIQLL